ncbi:MAG: DUF58 domain-containing protein [Pseudomonas sp.]|nr:DUF58 domain-containing protein [Pseudomonas sp.]
MIIKPSGVLLSSVAAVLLLTLGLGSLRALAVALPSTVDSILLAVVLGLVVLALYDVWRVYRQPPPSCQRTLAQTLSLGQLSDVSLIFSHSYKRPLRMAYLDHLPDSFQLGQQPIAVTLAPGHSSTSSYPIKPLQRGDFIIAGCSVRLPSPVRLWTAQYFLAQPSRVRVYPDFSRLDSGQRQSSAQWLGQLGAQQQRPRGSGLEFQQLREFRSDDSRWHLDCKASARKQRLIARDYQAERGQPIIFILDCGRAMRRHDGALSHLDHALNTCVLVAYSALRQGDAVGLQTFAGPKHIIAPAKGQAQIPVLLNSLYAIQASQDTPNFSAMAKQLLLTQKRRALLIVISTQTENAQSDLIPALQQLNKSHRTLLVNLGEVTLDQLRQQPLHSHAQALLYCAAIDRIQARDQHQQSLISQGIELLDVQPNQLTAKLLKYYLTIKKSGQH